MADKEISQSELEESIIVGKAFTECVGRLRERWLKRCKREEEIFLSDAPEGGDVGDMERLDVMKPNSQLRDLFQQRKQKARNGKGGIR